MMFIVAVLVGISLIGLVTVGFYLSTPVFRTIMSSLNTTAYVEMTGTPLSHFNRFTNFYTNLWGPIAVILVLGIILYVYLYAQRKEYVTTGGRTY